MPSGGNHPPATPATVSGPGALSQRTDGNAPSQAARYIAGGDYGSGGQMAIQQGAPMAASGAPGSAPASASAQGMPAQQGSPVVQLTEPTQRPDEPVTSGADAGPGPSSDVLRLAPQAQMGGGSAASVIQNLAAHPDASPGLKTLAALMPKSSPIGG